MGVTTKPQVTIPVRNRERTKRSSLADFFIGAHAAVAGCDLLIRDVARYRS